jgi:hypothetical protein
LTPLGECSGTVQLEIDARIGVRHGSLINILKYNTTL